MFSFIYLAAGGSFILFSVLQQSEFSTECDLVFNLSIYSIQFPKGAKQLLTSSSSSSRHFFTSLFLSFNNVFQKAVSTQDMTKPVSLMSFNFCRIFLITLTLCNASSFLTRSLQPIFPSFSSTRFQNFPGVSDILSIVFNSQHLAKLYYKCSRMVGR